VGWTTFLPGTHRIEAAERALHKASTGDALDMIHPRLKGVMLQQFDFLWLYSSLHVASRSLSSFSFLL
jgi:hypothetical protein